MCRSWFRFLQKLVEREGVMGIPCMDDEETEVLLHHEQVLTPSGQTTVFFD
jgi:hypothetical protein